MKQWLSRTMIRTARADWPSAANGDFKTRCTDGRNTAAMRFGRSVWSSGYSGTGVGGRACGLHPGRRALVKRGKCITGIPAPGIKTENAIATHVVMVTQPGISREVSDLRHMANLDQVPSIPAWAVQRMRALHQVLSTQTLARRIREQIFTDADRDSIPENPTTLADMPQQWARLRGIRIEEAVLELAEGMNLSSAGECMNLRQALGIPQKPHDDADPNVPQWDDFLHVLRLGGQVIRRFQRPTRSQHAILILRSFQEGGWPVRIDDPLPGGRKPDRLRETIRSLNSGLEMIRFFADGSGQGVRWELLTNGGK